MTIKYYVTELSVNGFSQSDINGPNFLEVNSEVNLTIKDISSAGISVQNNKAILPLPTQTLPTVDSIYQTLGIKIIFNDGVNGEIAYYTYHRLPREQVS